MKNVLLLLALFTIFRVAHADTAVNCLADVCQGDVLKAQASDNLIPRLYNGALGVVYKSNAEFSDLKVIPSSITHEITNIDLKESFFSTETKVEFKTRFTVIPMSCYPKLMPDNSYGHECKQADRSKWKSFRMGSSISLKGNPSKLKGLIQEY